MGETRQNPQGWDTQKLTEHISKMHDAADTGTGTRVWRLDIVYAPNALDMLSSKDRRELALVQACGYLIQQVQGANPPILCALCEHEFKGDLPYAIVFLTVDQHTNALGNGVCEACATRPDLMGRVSEFYSKNVFLGDFRKLDVVEEVGHA